MSLLNRRSLMMDMEGEEVKEWKVLLEKTVEDNNILYYRVETSGCKEFYVSIFFANDEEITSGINGMIAVNEEGSPWNRPGAITVPITTLTYKAEGNNNKAVVIGFELVHGKIIPTRQFQSYNAGASSHTLGGNSQIFQIGRTEDKNSLYYKEFESIESISVGSYTKYFGRGSKILILGR